MDSYSEVVQGMTNYYLEQKVWKRRDASTAVLYRCLLDIRTNMFAVQSADFFHEPFGHEQLLSSEKQFLELLVQTEPADRCEWFESLDKAISAHERDFS